MRSDPTGPSTVDLWKIPLTHRDPPLESLSGLLSPDEAYRASRFVFQKDREKFIRVRGLLRIILSGYLEIRPEMIEFRYEAAGKPFIADTLNPSRLHFNVSHSGEIALIAVGTGRELGVDVEHVRRDINVREIAKHFFSAREILELLNLPEAQQTLGFFNCWTRKEAFVKAIGTGLALPLDAFDVSLRPGEPAALNRAPQSPRGREQWVLLDVSPSGDYVAALAVEGEFVSLVWRSL